MGGDFVRPPRVGTKVRFAPSPASFALYSKPPFSGELGTVTTVAFPGGKRASLPGPGGGLVYVAWAETGIMGVSLWDIERAPK